MHWRDKKANGFVVKLGVTHPAEASMQFVDFLISGLVLLMAIGGLAM
jgi:hypothetical protein